MHLGVTYVCTYIRKYIRTYIFTHESIYVPAYIRDIRTYVRTCVRTHIRTNIRTDIHTNILTLPGVISAHFNSSPCEFGSGVRRPFNSINLILGPACVSFGLKFATLLQFQFRNAIIL